MVAGIFAYGEYGAIRNTSLFGHTSDEVPVDWQYECLVGIGKKFSVAKFMNLSVTLLYDFNHRNNDTHPRPFVMRIGYGLKGSGMLKKKG